MGYRDRPGTAPRERHPGFLSHESQPIGLGLVLFLLVGAAFLPSLRNGFVSYDDDGYVTSNLPVQAGLSWEGIKWAFQPNQAVGNWHPLTWLSHMLDCRLFGLSAGGHHLTSLGLHGLSTVLLFVVFRRMTGTMWRSFFLAALFGLHPLRVESVAWVAERKDVLSVFFFMLALWAYARFAEIRAPQSEPRSPKLAAESTARPGVPGLGGEARPFPARFWYWAALCMFALGLMSKPMLVTLPFVLLLLDYWPLRRFSSPAPGPDLQSSEFKAQGSKFLSARVQFLGSQGMMLRLFAEKVPFFLLAGLSSAVTFQVQQSAGAMVEMTTLSWAARAANALVAYCRYLGKLFYPAKLAFFYPHPTHWPVSVVLASGLLLVVLTVLALALRRSAPWVLVGWLWFVGTLVPVIGLVQVGVQSMADRYSYIPSVGIILICVWGGYALTRKRRFRVVVVSLAAAGMTLLCLVLARRQVGYWRDSETLFRQGVAATDNNYLACLLLGGVLADRGQTDEALELYRRAVQIAGSDKDARITYGDALLTTGRVEEAMIQFQAALALDQRSAEAHNGLGAILKSQRRLDEALEQFELAVALKPALIQAHSNLGNALALKGRFPEAIQQFEQALKLKPNFPEVECDLAAALTESGRRDEAIVHLKEALRLNPGFADAERQLRALGLSPAR